MLLLALRLSSPVLQYVVLVAARTVGYLLLVFLYGGIALDDFDAADYDMMRATISLSQVVIGVTITSTFLAAWS